MIIEAHVCAERQEQHAVGDRLDHEDAEQGRVGAAAPAEQRGAADHRRRDGVRQDVARRRRSGHLNSRATQPARRRPRPSSSTASKTVIRDHRGRSRPARRAASGLPPTAKSSQPEQVRRRTRSKITTRPPKISSASGRPLLPDSSLEDDQEQGRPAGPRHAARSTRTPASSHAAALAGTCRRTRRSRDDAAITNHEPVADLRGVVGVHELRDAAVEREVDRALVAEHRELEGPASRSGPPGSPRTPARRSSRRRSRARGPIAAPRGAARGIAGTAAMPWLTFSTARIAEVRPLTEPTDRSISPSSSTSTMPSEIDPDADICCTRFERFSAERKRGRSGAGRRPRSRSGRPRPGSSEVAGLHAPDKDVPVALHAAPIRATAERETSILGSDRTFRRAAGACPRCS